MISNNKAVVLLGLVGSAIISLLIYIWRDDILNAFKGNSNCEEELAKLRDVEERRRQARQKRRLAPGKIRNKQKPGADVTAADEDLWLGSSVFSSSAFGSSEELREKTSEQRYAVFETAFPDCPRN